MEEGSLRVDANISVRASGESEHGTKVEVKNMNSIRSVGRALEYEEMRQRRALEAGEHLPQETRHFDEKTGTTSSLRTKEYAFDYRYFPEPDLVPFRPPQEWVDEIASAMPELPAARRARFASQYGLGAKDVEVLTASKGVADWFEAAATAYEGDPKKIVNWIIADLFGLLNEAGIELSQSKVTPQGLAGLVRLIDSGAISGKQAKLVLGEMFESGGDAGEIAAARRLRQESDEGAIAAVVDEVIAANPDAAAKVRAGQMGTVGFLVGQVMKKTKGQANPALASDLLRSKLT
jgi:aspartyl-tRNA(Asn)/glutamyl-tRNA(Gln) amidotransferase subunit B